MASVGPVVIVHGGAYAIPDRLVALKTEGCRIAAENAHKALKEGKSAMDAVEIAVRLMEDNEVFNAGHGSALTTEGKVEMDAIVMDGRSLNFGAVVGVQTVSNPVSLARLVLERSEHVMLGGEGADRYAREMGVPEIKNAELVSEEQQKNWKGISTYGSVVDVHMNKVEISKSAGVKGGGGEQELGDLPEAIDGHDTVGAVAMDVNGDLAAATSTGGIGMKHPGRIGDAGLVGSGAYCSNTVGGVSCTGHGESIARVVLAQRVLSRLESHGEEDPESALKEGLEYMLKKTGGRGGLILIDGKGRMAKGFSTVRMAWASVDQSGRVETGMDEPRHHI